MGRTLQWESALKSEQEREQKLELELELVQMPSMALALALRMAQALLDRQCFRQQHERCLSWQRSKAAHRYGRKSARRTFCCIEVWLS